MITAKKNLLVLLLILFIMGCGSKKEDTVLLVAQSGETPKALEESNARANKRMFSSGYGSSDVIDLLYKEALEKDAILQKLNEAIQQMEYSKNEKTGVHQKYLNTNQNYWNAAQRYITNINDTSVRKATAVAFQQLEAQYAQSMNAHVSKLAQIAQRKTALQDKLTLMKLMISASMMKNYQRNEKPSLDTLKNIIKEYDQLILETQEHSK